MGAEKMPTPARGSKLVLAFGLVNVPVKMAPFVRSTSIPGKTVCAEHATLVESGPKTCTFDGHEVEETATGFDVGGRYVIVDRREHRSSRDGQLALKNRVDLAELDHAVYEKTYLVWPQDGAETVYDLFAAALRDTETALIGTTTVSTSTKAVAIRWSTEYEALMAHVLAYDAAIASGDAKLVADGVKARPEPDKAQLAMAKQLLDTLTSDFELADVEDSYSVSLQAAIDAARDGLPAPEPEEAPAVAPAADLMAALAASIDQAKPAKKPAKPKRTRKEVAA